MLLTELKIKGFKSFGNKVTINFNKGITGIVGPNGCGKSNVVDAIRWVLGEQRSSALRSEKMENIIFNGTKKRHATQLAEVTLSFDNTKNILPTEYNKVSVSRKYYRSGDSEYLLNGVACRLKDITNLFLDSGISSNPYSIIELKMIDGILVDREGARRALFEEAASISKFKNRKKKTFKQLEGTTSDLDRVDDLLFEIKKNLKSLEQQAKRAERYLKIKDEYRKYSIKFGQKATLNFQKKRKSILDNIQESETRKSEFIKTFHALETTIEVQKNKMIKKENLLKISQKELNNQVYKIRQFESNKKIKNERLKYLNEKAHTLDEQLTNDKKSKQKTEVAIQSLTNEQKKLEKNFLVIETEYEKIEKQKHDKYKILKKKEKQQQKMILEVQNIQKENYEIDKELEVKKIQIETFEKELQTSSLDTKEKVNSLTRLEKKINTLEIQIEKKQKQLSLLKTQKEKIDIQIENVQVAIQNINHELEKKNRAIDAKRNEYDLTFSMVNSLEGYPEAIKYLTKKTKWGKNKQLLSDILTCQTEYRIAVENFLKPYINYYVVDTFHDALKAIDILYDATKGKANFFCLESFKHIKLTPQVSKTYAVAATEIIDYDKKYEQLFAYLLHNVFIVEGISKKLFSEHDIIILTKDGKLIKNCYSMNGGSAGLFDGGRIGRVKNLVQLKNEIAYKQLEIDKIKQTLVKKEKELLFLKENNLESLITKQSVEINQEKQEHITSKTKFEQIEKFISSQKERKVSTKESINDIKHELTLLIPKQASLAVSLTKKELEQKQHQQELNSINQSYKEVINYFSQKQIQKIQLENVINQLIQNIDNKKNILESTIFQISKKVNEEKLNNQSIKQLLGNAEESDNDLLAMYDLKQKLDNDVQEIEKEYYAIRGEIEQLRKEVKIVQKNRSDIDEIISQYKEEKNEVNLEITALTERLSAEFEVNSEIKKTNASLVQYPELDQLSEEELSEKITSLKQKMNRMGEINPMAKTSYDEIKERFEFVTLQKNDLLKAKQTLLNTVEEIEKYAVEKFLETFEKIQVNFKKVFRSLFAEGDDCNLVFTDASNPLESTIDIIAKPKGKKPLSINQLSGGEKSLTAIALLFSLYLLKPAPFCIFDEVDAPLDDANIDKFNSIIKQFSADSQFIIVTHNKRTMTITDVIYGVTMVEQGISEVIPVDFSHIV